MTWAIYCRVSTFDQNPEAQLPELERYAKAMGWKYETFMETMSTRKTRPVKAEVLRKLRNKELEGVLVWKLDRWGRSAQELHMEFDEFVNKGIKFYSLRDGMDISTATGRMIAGVLAAFAQFERDIIRERTMLGLEAAKKQGRKGGRPKGSKDKGTRSKSGYYLRWKKAP